MTIIARGPKVPANGSTAAWRTILVDNDTELVVYAEYYRKVGTELTHGIYFRKGEWRGAIGCFAEQVKRDTRRILTERANS